MKSKFINVKTKKEIECYNFSGCGFESFIDFYKINKKDFNKYFEIECKNILIKKNIKCKYYNNTNVVWQSIILEEKYQIYIDDVNFDEYFEII